MGAVTAARLVTHGEDTDAGRPRARDGRGEAAEHAAVAVAREAPQVLSTRSVASLQRMAGNRSVAGVLASVQRCGPNDCNCSPEERAANEAGMTGMGEMGADEHEPAAPGARP